ncbi:MAG: hypothetical protein LBC65_03445 [Oscillospiraceae bacterium]|jgi:hypothetical protein|nr:hypothetical protein [Oscillospiraceae bacterium]
MEKQKKPMLESPLKSFVYTFLMYALAVAEIGLLSGLRFVFPTPNGRNGADIGLAGSTKGYELSTIFAEVGMQFIVMSIALFVAVILYAFYLGFKRQPYGLYALVLVTVVPVLGMINLPNQGSAGGLYNIFWTYGTAGFLPLMSLFGLHHLSGLPIPAERTTEWLEISGRNTAAGANAPQEVLPALNIQVGMYSGVMVFFAITAVLLVVSWLLGKLYRKSYSEKYEFDLSVPLV